MPTRTLIWCVGVRADPLVESLGLKTEKGRVVVDEFMRVPGHPEVFACGDAAAVPDPTRPGQATAMTAQHAQRQGKLVARNVAASLGHGTAHRYKHHDLGFVVELGGRDAAANPLHVPLAGLPAKAVTRGYHLAADAGEPDPDGGRLGARRGAAAPDRAARAGARRRGAAGDRDAGAPAPPLNRRPPGPGAPAAARVPPGLTEASHGVTRR